MSRTDIRLALPSKGRLYEDSLAFLAEAGLPVYRPNPRQYEATIPALPGLTVMFQRPGDIVVSVSQGSVDFGLTGRDVLEEKRQPGDPNIVDLHDELGFSRCRLALAMPDDWAASTEDQPVAVGNVADLAQVAAAQGRPLRVATKFPALTGRFLTANDIPYELILVEGTLEIAPAIGYADLIADLVSTGTTLRDNHLRPIPGGLILESEANLIGCRQSLQARPEVLAMARELLEFIEAHLRAQNCYLIFANMRGDSEQAIAAQMLTQPELSGLQGPTISPVFPPNGLSRDVNWFAINIVVRKPALSHTIRALRAIGGSGVIVTPVTYIFEEEPQRYQQMLAALTPVPVAE